MRLWLARILAVTTGILLILVSAVFALMQNP